MPNCIYCSEENDEPSREHVVAAGFGGALTLPADMVCKACNGVFDREIDRPVRADLDQVVVDVGAVNRRGETSSRVVVVDTDGGERRLKVTRDEVSAAEGRKLIEKQGASYQFRGTSLEQLEQARRDIEAKNPGKQVVLTDLEERPLPVPPDERNEVDFEQEHWRRWASKTAANVIAYALGRDAILEPSFDELRRHARYGGAVPSGLSWGGTNGSEDTADLPARHSIDIIVAGGSLKVVVKLFDYCGLAFSGPVARPDLSRSIILDAETGKVESDTER